MKRILLSGLVLSLCFVTAIGQRSIKDPNEIGACINISAKLPGLLQTRPIVNGLVSLWTLDEVKLAARVTEKNVGGRKERVRQAWVVLDLQGNPVAFDENSRSRPRAGRTLLQQLVYTRGTNPEGCFVVEQKDQ